MELASTAAAILRLDVLEFASFEVALYDLLLLIVREAWSGGRGAEIRPQSASISCDRRKDFSRTCCMKAGRKPGLQA